MVLLEELKGVQQDVCTVVFVNLLLMAGHGSVQQVPSVQQLLSSASSPLVISMKQNTLKSGFKKQKTKTN